MKQIRTPAERRNDEFSRFKNNLIYMHDSVLKLTLFSDEENEIAEHLQDCLSSAVIILDSLDVLNVINFKNPDDV